VSRKIWQPLPELPREEKKLKLLKLSVPPRFTCVPHFSTLLNNMGSML
jgi:hypothetical protein